MKRLEPPPTRYARAGSLHIAYHVLGQGPPDLVYLREYFDHLEADWEVAPLARFMLRMASFSRLIMFDKAGTGMSDPTAPSDHPTLEAWIDEMVAVLDAVGAQRISIVAAGGSGPMAALFAASHPDRVDNLVLINSYARLIAAPDYPQGEQEAEVDALAAATVGHWGSGRLLWVTAPSVSDDEAFITSYTRLERLAASPGLVAAVLPTASRLDVSTVLPSIAAPTLVLHRTGNRYVRVDHGQYLADHVPGARFVELPGDDYLCYVGDVDVLLDEIETFLTGSAASATADRTLATVLFTDIVGSTELATAQGDRRWQDLLEAHHRLVRRQLSRFGGVEVDTAGDGFFATFDGPARAIRCACAIRDGVRSLGLRVRIGLHTGEVELNGDKVSGVAVHIGARVAAQAEPGEVLVSRTVVDLVAGSTVDFVDRGEHSLKGVPGTWRLFAVDA